MKNVQDFAKRETKFLKKLGITAEQWQRASDLDDELSNYNIVFSFQQLLRFIMNGEGSAEEIASQWDEALTEDRNY